MQRLIINLWSMISRLFGCGCQEIVGVVGMTPSVSGVFLPARSFGMRLAVGLMADVQTTYYVADKSAAAILRGVHKPRGRHSRAGWRLPQPKWTGRRTARP